MKLRLLYTRREEPGRYMRCCPYCNVPVVWRYFGKGGDPKNERAFCVEHGPLSLWRVIDFDYPLGPAIIAEATTFDPPLVPEDVYGPPWEGNARARVLPRFLRTPLLVALSKPASVRWKRTRTKRLSGLRQKNLLAIDLSTLSARTKKRVIARWYKTLPMRLAQPWRKNRAA